MYKPIRVQFCKRDAAVYFSHLDLNRTVMRLLRKSGIDFWYTEGFNPHPHIVFAAPLSLGFESECEIFEFKADDFFGLREKIKLKSVFPDSLQIKEIYESSRKFGEIAYARYEIIFAKNEDILPLFDAPLTALKKTKRSENIVDVRAYLSDVAQGTDSNGKTVFTADFCFGSNNLNPNVFLSALAEKGIDIENACVRRIAFLDAQKNCFR